MEFFILVLFFVFLYLLGDDSYHDSYDEELEKEYDKWSKDFKRKYGK